MGPWKLNCLSVVVILQCSQILYCQVNMAGNGNCVWWTHSCTLWSADVSKVFAAFILDFSSLLRLAALYLSSLCPAVLFWGEGQYAWDVHRWRCIITSDLCTICEVLVTWWNGERCLVSWSVTSRSWLVCCDSRFGLPLSLTSSKPRAQLLFTVSLHAARTS